MAKRNNRSKYKFSELEIGSTFSISPRDELSMKNSLRFYNKEHNKSVKVKLTEVLSDEEVPEGEPAIIKSLTVERVA